MVKVSSHNSGKMSDAMVSLMFLYIKLLQTGRFVLPATGLDWGLEAAVLNNELTKARVSVLGPGVVELQRFYNGS